MPEIRTIDHLPLSIDERGVCDPSDSQQVRSNLLEPKQIELCKQWLSRATKSETPSISSFWVKHVVESWAGTSISNGALIVAAYEAGFPIARERNATDANVTIGLHSTDVEEFDCGCGHP